MRKTLMLVLVLFGSAGAGCIGANEAPVETTAAEVKIPEEPPVLPKTETIEGMLTSSVATPVRTLSMGDGGTISPSKKLAGVVVELEWTPASPASEKLSIWVRPASAAAVPPADPTTLVLPPEPTAKAVGASPLRLVLPVEALSEQGDYMVLVRAAAEPVGAAANQPFTLYLTTFKGIPFDDTYSALKKEPA